MCNLFRIEKTRTTPYHPQSDGMVERMNRTIQDMLAKYVAEHQRDWDVHLPMIMMAYRSVFIPLPSTHLHEREGDGKRNILWGWPNRSKISFSVLEVFLTDFWDVIKGILTIFRSPVIWYFKFGPKSF